MDARQLEAAHYHAQALVLPLAARGDASGRNPLYRDDSSDPDVPLTRNQIRRGTSEAVTAATQNISSDTAVASGSGAGTSSEAQTVVPPTGTASAAGGTDTVDASESGTPDPTSTANVGGTSTSTPSTVLLDQTQVLADASEKDTVPGDASSGTASAQSSDSPSVPHGQADSGVSGAPRVAATPSVSDVDGRNWDPFMALIEVAAAAERLPSGSGADGGADAGSPADGHQGA